MSKATRHCPELTVVSAFYNRQDYLDAFLHTIEDQSLRPAHTIIVDDGSTPPLVCPKRDDLSLIRLTKNEGPANARNRGVQAATTPYIAFLDSDDRWHKDKLARQFDLLSTADDEVFGVLCDYRRTGRKIRANIVHTPKTDNWVRFFLMGIRCGPGSTLMFRRDAFLQLGGFHKQLRRYEDWDFLLRAARSKRGKFLTIKQPLADVELTGRPDPALTLKALDLIEEFHFSKIEKKSDQRLFKAALNIERAAVCRWGGMNGKMAIHLLKALTSPTIVKRELLLTLNRS